MMMMMIFSPPVHHPLGGASKKRVHLAHSGPPVWWFLACSDINRKGVWWCQRWIRNVQLWAAMYTTTWMSCHKGMLPLLLDTLKIF